MVRYTFFNSVANYISCEVAVVAADYIVYKLAVV
jgi:hypothetical protein